MQKLKLSMLEQYDIPFHRPSEMPCVIFGANRLMLGAVARLLDEIQVGALMISPVAARLREQDCLFTLRVRGEVDGGAQLNEERVVQSILRAIDPKDEFDAFMEAAKDAALQYIFFPADCSELDVALLARFLLLRFCENCSPMQLFCVGDAPEDYVADGLHAAILNVLSDPSEAEGFAAWLNQCSFTRMAIDTLCGRMSETERKLCERSANYADSFMGWAEPSLKCALDGDVPSFLQGHVRSDYDAFCFIKLRIFASIIAIAAPMGFLCGLNTLSEVMSDEDLRRWVGEAFMNELMPTLPGAQEDYAAEVISAFGRISNPMNDVSLLDAARGLMKDMPRTLLPAIRDYAQREGTAPRALARALAAGIMLECGARANAHGNYEVLRDGKLYTLVDDPEILLEFAKLAPDMPADTLAYAALSNYDLWGEDLREIPELEALVTSTLSLLQG